MRVSWGHQTSHRAQFHLTLATHGVSIVDAVPKESEPSDVFANGTWSGWAGSGDVDALEFKLQFPPMPIGPITNLHRIWAALLEQSDTETVARLRQDPAYRPDPRVLTLRLNEDGTRGFSLTVDQLLQNRTFWVPTLDVYLATGDAPLRFARHQQELQTRKGWRILDQVERAPEATYAQYTSRWEDMGHPAYQNSAQVGPGHIVGITWDSALFKFGIDRGAGVWNDYGNSDRFHVWFDFGELSQDLAASWKSQRLVTGLPVIQTALEKDGVRYEIEQFSYPLRGPPPERRGDIPMVLLQKVTLRNLREVPLALPVKLWHRRLLPDSSEVRLARENGVWVLQEATRGETLLSLQGAGGEVSLTDIPEKTPAKPERADARWRKSELAIAVDLPARGSRQLLLKVPSPVVNGQEQRILAALDYQAAREHTLVFWGDYLDQGARFQVPEPAVNELVRASLWHALRLPRRHGGAEGEVKIDLPYSNFAYDQRGTPWPVNQAIYVDYMIYDLRGYHAISAEELAAIYRHNQEANGHVGGYANWGVYTPSMMYAVAKNFLLSGDKTAFQSLLPPTLKALDWCLSEIRKGSADSARSGGLVRAPLNDGTGDGVWAFNQAYFYAGLDLLGKALARIDHPRAGECQAAAASFRAAIVRAFGAATLRSPLVPLRDGTWIPYVPCEALSPRRLLEQWYPTDIDTGATHLPRLNAIDPQGPLTESLLHDHEDNLYLHGWGMANEPVYNQQATAYLYRDDAKAVIRAFYSMMACAFSHSVFEPVEHRWNWGQYFGPPSTDGAWFDLFRHMLIRELPDDSLLLLQAVPRAWLEDGKTIEVQRAPTYFGELSFAVESQASAGRLLATIELPARTQVKALLLRLRHPQGRALRSVTVNGASWQDYEPGQEWVRIPAPRSAVYRVVAEY